MNPKAELRNTAKRQHLWTLLSLLTLRASKRVFPFPRGAESRHSVQVFFPIQSTLHCPRHSYEALHLGAPYPCTCFQALLFPVDFIYARESKL